MRGMTEVGFYAALTVTTLTLLYIRNRLSRSTFGGRWFGLPLVGILWLLVATAFAGVFVHDYWFGEFSRAIENEWLQAVYVIGPLIWVGVIAAFYNRLFGR